MCELEREAMEVRDLKTQQRAAADDASRRTVASWLQRRRYLESTIDRPRKYRSSERTIPILGILCKAVAVFVRFLYTSKCSEEELDKFGIHLLAVSHVFLVPQLKQRCTKALGERLTIDNVVDMLQLARLCDAPDLYLRCMKLASNDFKSVEKIEDGSSYRITTLGLNFRFSSSLMKLN